MKLFPSFEPDGSGGERLVVRYRAEGPDTIGDGAFVMTPGETAAGLTYDQWADAARGNEVIEA